MRLRDAVTVAKQSVSAVEAADALGLSPDRYGRCACPIHGGHDRNMKLYGGARGYYCYVCHSGGDVIDLVQRVNGCGMREAVEWLDSTFRLGLDVGRDTDRRKADALRELAERRKARREAKEAYSRRLFAAQTNALATEMAVEDIIEAERPHKYSEDFSDAFCEALMARERLRAVTEELFVMAYEEGGI